MTDIAVAIAQAMRWNVDLPPDKVKATVKNGWVTLEGTVPWSYQRDIAAKLARGIRGVVSVSNTITLEPRALPEDVEKEIRAALHRQADLDAHSVHVLVRDGTATLTGKVSIGAPTPQFWCAHCALG